MTIMLKPELYAKLSAGKNIITPLYVLHPLAGQDERAYFYNKRTGEGKPVDVTEMKHFGKVVKA